MIYIKAEEPFKILPLLLYEINQDPENASQLIQKALAVIGKMAEKTGVRLNGNGTFMNLYNQSF